MASALGAALAMLPAPAPAGRGVGPAPHPAGCAPPATGGEWRSSGHDLANTRHQDAEHLIGPDQAITLAPVWTFSSRGAGGAGDFTGTPVVADGCVFVGSNMGWVFAINADTGGLVWKAKLANGGTVNSSLAVEEGRVFAFVSRVSSPYVAALDEATGETSWETTVDHQEGADAFASPVVFEGTVFAGVSGDAAQHGEEGQRLGFRGSFVLLDAATGALLAKTYTIPREDWEHGFAGATVSAPPAIDPVARVAYVGTGSAFAPQAEHPHANAILKIDLDRGSPTFGQILAAYKGDTFDAVVPGYGRLPCYDLSLPPPPPIVPTGRGVGACGDVDADFAASPVLFQAGRTLVGAPQKSGFFHAVDARNMDRAWRARYGPAQPFGGSSPASDGVRVYSSAGPGGYVYALDPWDGSLRWASPVADGPHYGHPVASANGVVYTVDVKGFLDAYDAANGRPVLHRPMELGGATGADPVLTFGGVSVARNTIYAAVGIQNTGLDVTGSLNGYVIAFRPRP